MDSARTPDAARRYDPPPPPELRPLNDGVRRIEDARDTAARNVEYLDREIGKAEREVERLTEEIARMREERSATALTLAEAEAILDA